MPGLMGRCFSVLDEHLTEKQPNRLLSLALNSGFQGLTFKALKTQYFFLNFQHAKQNSSPEADSTEQEGYKKDGFS